ncbi:MAG: DUF2480 family protein [Bacteroidetes bacterium]|nr:DUF2480 family protein [Bacteroidota bacterium]
MEDVIINKVAESGLITIDPASYYPKAELITFDMKGFLFMEMILKEKEFRQALKDLDWNKYSGKVVAITCSADAIIPLWAYMLVATYLEPVADQILFGTEAVAFEKLFLQQIKNINAQDFTDKKVVIKGCGSKPIPASVYVEIVNMLRPVVKSIMYGEPCSTVPVYKKK